MKVVDMKILLASVNRMHYRNHGLRTKYKETRERIRAELKKEMIAPPYSVIIDMETYLDIDNPVKLILDALQGVVIDDDKNVLKLEIIKNRIKRGHEGNLKVYVCTLKDYKKKFEGTRARAARESETARHNNTWRD